MSCRALNHLGSSAEMRNNGHAYCTTIRRGDCISRARRNSRTIEQVFGFPSDEATSGLTNVGGAKKIVADDTFQRRRGIDVRHPL